MIPDVDGFANFKTDAAVHYRFGAAQHAARAIKAAHPDSMEDDRTRMVDLLADLMHLAHYLDIDWDDLSESAESHYSAEVDDYEQ